MKQLQFTSFCFFGVLMFCVGHWTGTWIEDMHWLIPCILGFVGTVTFITSFAE